MRGTVHPRVCGELVAVMVGITGWFGSSPRVWGTRPLNPGYLNGLRFIPACVGNSLFSLFTLSSLPVHPRVCGELL